MNRRILISENERSRILGLHENRRMKEWGLINEEMIYIKDANGKASMFNGSIPPIGSTKIDKVEFDAINNQLGTGSTPAPVVPAPEPVAKAPEPVAKAPFIPTGYDTIEACKAAGAKDVSSKVFAGQDWEVVKAKWVESKCNGTTPCIAGTMSSNINLRKAICEGTFTMGGPAAATPSEYTVYKGGVPSKMTVDQISQGLADGTIKPTDKVWDTTKGQGSDAIVPLSTLTSDTKIQASIKTIAPELAGVEKTYEISADGRAAAIKYTKETLTKAIADGTLNKDSAYVIIVDPATQAKSYQKIMLNTDLIPIINSASGAQPITAERKSTNIPELDAWLKGPIGSAWDKLTDLKQKESMFDSFEKTDPIITKLKDTVGKGPLRSALGMAADTGVGRGLQRLRGKVGASITGNQPVD